MTRRGVIGLFAGAATAVLAGCGALGRSPSYRFRMTVEIQTPQGLKTGSSVMEVSAGKGIAIGDSSGVSAVTRGEAVVVDLPGGPIFVLLQLPAAGGSLQSVVGDALLGRPSESPDGFLADVAKLGRASAGEYKGDLPHSKWPMMVRFRDLSDPKSVELVDPDAIGVKRIAVETTQDLVTKGIEKNFAWFSQYLDRHLDGTSAAMEDLTTNNLASHTSSRSFSTETVK